MIVGSLSTKVSILRTPGQSPKKRKHGESLLTAGAHGSRPGIPTCRFELLLVQFRIRSSAMSGSCLGWLQWACCSPRDRIDDGTSRRVDGAAAQKGPDDSCTGSKWPDSCGPAGFLPQFHRPCLPSYRRRKTFGSPVFFC